MESYSEKIHVIENFLNKDQCNILFDKYNEKIWDAADPNIKTGFGVSVEEAKNFYESDNYLAEICRYMGKVISVCYGKDMELKSLFHSVMNIGAKNSLHWDNYIENGEEDVSALLYINDDFAGGELYFPNQNLIIKPKSGTFVFFQGDESVEHEVKTVTDGSRNAFVGFYWPRQKRIRVMP